MDHLAGFKKWLDQFEAPALRAFLIDAWWKDCFAEIPPDGNCADVRPRTVAS